MPFKLQWPITRVSDTPEPVRPLEEVIHENAVRALFDAVSDVNTAWLRCRNMGMSLSLWMDWDARKIVVYKQHGVNRMQVTLEDVLEDAQDDIDEELMHD